jgi:hypothetical protein
MFLSKTAICPVSVTNAAALFPLHLSGVSALVRTLAYRLQSYLAFIHRIAFLSVYTRQRDSVCVKVALLSRVIVPYGGIIPLSSIMAGLLERHVCVLFGLPAPGMGNIRRDNKKWHCITMRFLIVMLYSVRLTL